MPSPLVCKCVCMYILYILCVTRVSVVCWRMLAYAGVCWRMLTYADVCYVRIHTGYEYGYQWFPDGFDERPEVLS